MEGMRMLSGLREILVVAAVLLALFLVPRLVRSKRGSAAAPAADGGNANGNGLVRLALLLSALWVSVSFVLLNPTAGSWVPFFGVGVLPVALGWGIRWVALGFR
jgi:hypothetical protein